MAGNDPGDYQGPTSTFTIANANSGTVNFNPGVAPGSSTFFSLEEPPTANLVVTPGGAPEPATNALLGAGLGVLLLVGRKFRNRR